MLIDPTARRNIGFCISQYHSVTDDFSSGRDVAQSYFVSLGYRLQGYNPTFQLCTCREVLYGYRHIILRLDLDAYTL